MRGDDVRRIRQQYLFTQAELATELGLALRTIQYWEATPTKQLSTKAQKKLREFVQKQKNPPQ